MGDWETEETDLGDRGDLHMEMMGDRGDRRATDGRQTVRHMSPGAVFYGHDSKRQRRQRRQTALSRQIQIFDGNITE